MIKKLIITILLFVSSIYANSTNKIKYLDEKEMDYTNFRPFIGIDASATYIDTTHALDKSMLGYGLYIGMPIFSWEIIAKMKKDTTRDFHVISKAISINMPIGGSGTDLTYVGIIGGKNKLTWRDHKITSLDIKDEILNNDFYGIHIGQKYKFTRNFYVRIELEYSKYDYLSKTSTSDIGADDSIAFNYGFEYKF